jgi:hypothetical protein
VKIHIVVSWVTVICSSPVGGHRRFVVIYCYNLHGIHGFVTLEITIWSRQFKLFEGSSIPNYLSMALQPLWTLPAFLIYTQSVGILGRGSVRRKAATYTQSNTNTEERHTDTHALSGIRTHDPSVRAAEDGSCHRPRGHCVRITY